VTVVASLPIVSVAVTDAAGAESGNDPIVFTVTRTGSTAAALDVQLAFGGAASAADYTVTVTGGSYSGGVLTIAAGTSTAIVTVRPVDDAAVESAESVTLTVIAAAGYARGATTSATGTIADNDVAPPPVPQVSVSATDTAGAEAAAANPIVFQVSRTTAAAAVSIALTWSGAASFGVDYTVQVSGGTLSADGKTLSLAPGALQATLTVTPVDDTLVEGAEAVTLAVGAGTGYTVGSPASASGTIADNDVAPPPVPQVTLTATDTAGAEAAANPIAFQISRTSAAAAISIALTWSGAASFGVDYTVRVTGGTLSADGRTLTLAVGALQATLTVTPVDDTVVEGAEGVTLAVGAGTGYTVGSPASASGTIADNDTAPVPTTSLVTVTATDSAGAENPSDTITFVITRTGKTDTKITILLAWTGTAAYGKDYTLTAAGGTLNKQGTAITLAAGVTTATLTLTPVRDTTTEPAETVVLTLTADTGYTLPGQKSVTGTITEAPVPAPAALLTDTGRTVSAEPVFGTVAIEMDRTVIAVVSATELAGAAAASGLLAPGEPAPRAPAPHDPAPGTVPARVRAVSRPPRR
jgi:hypothetical protein